MAVDLSSSRTSRSASAVSAKVFVFRLVLSDPVVGLLVPLPGIVEAALLKADHREQHPIKGDRLAAAGKLDRVLQGVVGRLPVASCDSEQVPA